MGLIDMFFLTTFLAVSRERGAQYTASLAVLSSDAFLGCRLATMASLACSSLPPTQFLSFVHGFPAVHSTLPT
eukprot:5532485-Prorocentrum_lima.AAC.1